MNFIAGGKGWGEGYRMINKSPNYPHTFESGNLRISSPSDTSKVELLNSPSYREALAQNSRLSTVRGRILPVAIVLTPAPVRGILRRAPKEDPRAFSNDLSRYKIGAGQWPRLQGQAGPTHSAAETTTKQKEKQGSAMRGWLQGCWAGKSIQGDGGPGLRARAHTDLHDF